MGDPDPIAGANQRQKARQNYSAESKKIDMQGQLNVDVFEGQSSMLLNGVDMRVKCWPSTARFCVMSPNEQ